MSERQLQLVDGAAPARPKHSDAAFRLATAKAIQPEVIRWLGNDHDGDDESVLRDIQEALNRSWDWDGFNLAHELKEKGWDCDRDLVEILDGATAHRSTAHRAAVRRWVRDWDIQPKLTIGTPVEIEHQKNAVAGEIISIDVDEAVYTVFCASLGHIRRDSGQTGTLGICLSFETVETSNNAGGSPS